MGTREGHSGYILVKKLAVPYAPVPWKWLPSMETGFGAVKVCHIFWGETGLLNSTGTVKDHRDF